MIKPWPKVDSRLLGDYRIFQVRSERKTSPVTGADHEFFVIDCVNWVNIVAITTDQKLILVEQYRHGSNTVELEIPGGMMDAEDATPEATGLRELREETGYEGEAAVQIGQVYPNPALQSNFCYTVLITNCHLKHEMAWDETEELTTRLVALEEIPHLVAQGKIRHSLVVVALYFFDLWQKGIIPRGPG